MKKQLTLKAKRRKPVKKLWSTTLVTLLAGLLLSAASAQDRELVITQGIDVPGFDVHSPGSSVTTVESVLVNIFDYLVWRDSDGNFIPGLATSWEPVAEDAWRFELREGVLFHDGHEFTAEDAKFTLERISRDESLAEYENYRQDRKSVGEGKRGYGGGSALV